MIWLRAILLLVLGTIAARASEIQLDQKPKNSQRCSGMYSRKSWGGDVDPFILTKFLKTTAEGDSDPMVSMIIFEWKDESYIGKLPTPESPEADRAVICDGENIKAGYCTEDQLGQFILADNNGEAKGQIITTTIHLRDPRAINYPIKKTGYYCVSTYGFTGDDYKAIVEFRNAYGELQAAQIAKLPFYGGLTIVYAVVGAFWAFLYAQHRHDILPVQNYITFTIGFLIVEMLMTWGYYDYQNRHGTNAGSKVLMTVVSILNAGRNSLSFFLLLIVCMGYGVVKPSLGRTMIIVRWLATAHFTFGVIYAVASLTITPDSAGPIVLLVILPLAGTLTAFYVWTLNSLNATMKDLMERKQNVKAGMYKKLWWCILASILVIWGFFFVNSFIFAGHSNPDYVPDHWQTRWFLLDGWLNLVYLVDLCFIAYLWRPTANNRRFAMSDELAQDDEGFEIASIGGSLDEEEGISPPNERSMPADLRDFSPDGTPPPPPPKPQQGPATVVAEPKPRESIDGDTLFAVGEDAEWGADDEDDDDDDDEAGGAYSERKRLTGKNA